MYFLPYFGQYCNKLIIIVIIEGNKIVSIRLTIEAKLNQDQKIRKIKVKKEKEKKINI